MRITTRVLRTVDRVGGLDEYLLGEKAGRIKELGMGGWKLRWRIMQTERVKERFRAQRERLGLPAMEEVLVGSSGNLANAEEVEKEVREFDQSLEMGADLGIGEEAEEVVEDAFMREEQLRGKDKLEL